MRFGKWKEDISTLSSFHGIPGKQWALANGSAGGGQTPCFTAEWVVAVIAVIGWQVNKPPDLSCGEMTLRPKVQLLPILQPAQ